MSKSAKAALKTHDAKEAASNPTRALTQAEQAVLDSGLASHTTRPARDEGDVDDDLENLRIERHSILGETNLLFNFFEEQADKNDEVRDHLDNEWIALTNDLNRIDTRMNTAVEELDPNSDKGRYWSRDWTRRHNTNKALHAKFTTLSQSEESQAAGS